MQTGEHGNGKYQHYHSPMYDSIISKKQIKKRIFYHFFKKLFDELLSIIAIILLFPVFVITGVSIKIEEPHGPIFYSQIRIGKNNRPFRMYKFRSMVINADKMLNNLLDQNDVEGAMFKMKSDPRVTRVGRIIRKYSIDELPQLVNVIKGDMALVGPRPPLKREVQKYTEYDKQRLLVTPGCTGLWQVSERNNVGFHRMVKLDIEYIRRSGIMFDLCILLRTVAIMIFPNDSY